MHINAHDFIIFHPRASFISLMQNNRKKVYNPKLIKLGFRLAIWIMDRRHPNKNNRQVHLTSGSTVPGFAYPTVVFKIVLH
jgi:hypothetical protein